VCEQTCAHVDPPEIVWGCGGPGRYPSRAARA
jgi:hypothetical protein